MTSEEYAHALCWLCIFLIILITGNFWIAITALIVGSVIVSGMNNE